MTAWHRQVLDPPDLANVTCAAERDGVGWTVDGTKRLARTRPPRGDRRPSDGFELFAERYWRDAGLTKIFEGTSEIQRQRRRPARRGRVVMSWDPAAALEEERERTRERLAGLTGDYAGIVAASVDSNADDEHDPEGATIAFERSQVGALVDQARLHLAEVDAALERVRDGSYGACERCGRTIAPGRLEARPVARTCITCAAR